MYALSLQISPVLPGWLVMLLAGALLIAVAQGAAVMARKEIAPRWVVLLTGLRLAIVGLFVAALMQPVISTIRSTASLPEMVVMVDVSKSMGLPGGAGSKTRLEESASNLGQGELAQALTSRFSVSWYHYDQNATAMEAKDLKSLSPGTKQADLGASLTDALEQLQALGKSPQRVLLVSDGNHRGMIDPAEVARKFGVRIDVLAPTRREDANPGNLEIVDVQGARRVLLGSETHFRINLRRASAIDPDQPLTLILEEDGQKIQNWPLVFKARETEQAIILAHRPQTVGTKVYTFRIEGQGGPSAKFLTQVVDGKYEILVLEDTWRWQYKFLHRIFEDDPSFRFTAILPRGAKSFVQFCSPDRRVPLIGMPQNRADLEGFDLFFLGDVNPSKWTPNLAKALAQLIIDEGKSLVVIAGPNLAQWADIPELHALLPVDLTSESSNPVSGPVDVRLRPDAAASPFFFQLRPGENTQTPPLDHVYPVLRKRLGATVLVETVKHRNAHGNLIVVAEHTVGLGKVMLVATDTLWKWHTLASDQEGPTPHAVFWQQAMRALTPRRTQLGSVNLWLTTSRSRGEVGQRLEIEAEVQAERPLPPVKIQARATLPDGKTLPLSFAVDSVRPQRFYAGFVPPTSGVCQIAATVLVEGQRAAEANAVIAIEEPGGASSTGRIDWAYLQRLAATSGGRLIDPRQPETFPTTPESALPTIERASTIDPWNNFSLLFLLCALLGLDWLIRLTKGFV